jgi:multiple sugar transport system permease protein
VAQQQVALGARQHEGARTSPLQRVLGRDWLLSWLMVGPVVLIVLALLIYPFVDAILLSFQDRFIGKTGTWIGLDNYAAFFNGVDSGFGKAFLVTFVFTGGAIAGKFIVGMAMASVLNQEIPARNIFRGIMFLPWAVPAVVSAYVWRFLFDTTGPINGMIAEYGWMDDYIYFFNDARIALPALILVTIWSGTPFWTMNFLAGMQAISKELYEAAEIDGADTIRRFWYITLPGLQSVIVVTAMLSTIWTSANLTQIFVLTGGGPNYATTTLPLYAYLTAIPGHRLGAGAAISMVIVPFYMILVYFLTRKMLRQEQES